MQKINLIEFFYGEDFNDIFVVTLESEEKIVVEISEIDLILEYILNKSKFSILSPSYIYKDVQRLIENDIYQIVVCADGSVFFDIYHKPIRKCERYKGLLVWKYLEKRSMKLSLYYSNKNIQEILHRSLNIDCKQN